MSKVVFPNSPTIGQVFTASGREWLWNGNGWELKGVDEVWLFEEIAESKILTTADAGKYFSSIAATDITVTFPQGLSKPVVIFQKGNGVVSFVDGDGVTHSGDVKTAGQNKAIFVAPESSTHYQIIGGIA